MNQEKPDYYYEQQACREKVQQSYFQTSHYSTDGQFTGQYSNNAQFTSHYSTNAQFADNARRVDGYSCYQQPSCEYSRQDSNFQNDVQYSRINTPIHNNVQCVKQDVYPQDIYNIHGDQQQFENPQQLDSSKIIRQQKVLTKKFENSQQLDSSKLIRQQKKSTAELKNQYQLDSGKLIRQQKSLTNNYENPQQLDSSKLLRQHLTPSSQYNHNYAQENYMPAGKHWFLTIIVYLLKN